MDPRSWWAQCRAKSCFFQIIVDGCGAKFFSYLKFLYFCGQAWSHITYYATAVTSSSAPRRCLHSAETLAMAVFVMSVQQRSAPNSETGIIHFEWF